MLNSAPVKSAELAREPDPIADAVTGTITALARGDLPSAHQAFRPIHDYYFWRVNRFIRWHLRYSADPEQESDDLTSEVFLQLWRQIDRVDTTRGPLSALLYTIARRLVNHRSKQNQVHRSREAPPAPPDGPDPLERASLTVSGDVEATQLDALEADWRDDNRSRLLDQLAQETPDAHEILRLRYQEQLTFKAVAQHLAISADSARQRDLTARLALFKTGWRLIREEEVRAGNSLRWHRPQSVAELAGLVQQEPEVAQLLTQYFGAVSWRLICPRREAHVSYT